MKRLRIVPLALLGIGLLLPASDWFSRRSAPSDSAGRAADADDLSSETALRHRRGEPRHWRGLFLHH